MIQKKPSLFERIAKFLMIGFLYDFIINNILQISPQRLKKIREKEN